MSKTKNVPCWNIIWQGLILSIIPFKLGIHIELESGQMIYEPRKILEQLFIVGEAGRFLQNRTSEKLHVRWCTSYTGITREYKEK